MADLIAEIQALEAKAASAIAAAADTEALQATLFAEMKGRIKEDDTSAKTSYLGYVYYRRTETDRQYPIYCRAKDAPGAAEEILLDLNQLGEGRAYVALGDYRVSTDGRRLVSAGRDRVVRVWDSAGESRSRSAAVAASHGPEGPDAAP
mgnify:CR=1 FL=1